MCISVLLSVRSIQPKATLPRLVVKKHDGAFGAFSGFRAAHWIPARAEPDSALLRRNGTMREKGFVHFRSTAAFPCRQHST